MSDTRSWFSKATASRYGLLPESSKHDLPRWRSPSPGTAASIIPPPIVRSTYGLSPRAVPMKFAIIEPTSPLESQQHELEADLQFLLDAQAEGLMRGLEGGMPDEALSTGSTTPTAQNVRGTPGRRSARPSQKKPGLRSARKGIYNSILALATVKDEELRAIQVEAADHERVIEQIEGWAQKQRGLEEAAQHVDDGEETARAQRLKQEADVMQQQINEMELQLLDLKTRQRKLLRQAAAGENAVQARLASYTSSLSMLEADVQNFLSLHGPDHEGDITMKKGRSSAGTSRTQRPDLEAAREQYQVEKDAVLHQYREVEHEKSALVEGAAVWQNVIARVTDFEKCLRAGMGDLSSSRSAWDEPHDEHKDSNERLKDLLGTLEDVLEHIDAQYKLAKQRQWKLLIAAIGAELDALRQGQSILLNVLGIAWNGHEHEDGLIGARGSENDSDGNEEGGEEIHDLDRDFESARAFAQRVSFPEDNHDVINTDLERSGETARRSSAARRPAVSDGEDDGPDPELLFSRQRLDR
ncbi:hypothetical protein LTR62_005358 [Meristemomyces frigidus]|uniref:Autophagy-related protein 28 n=1 Tax=Meristemomyces frigidus TaxID=1508187 RepID=A0AAN7TDJ6_9PEZI|nr:hypothetical protein LTR62_005358 [Meristemomyces frigidus]